VGSAFEGGPPFFFSWRDAQPEAAAGRKRRDLLGMEEELVAEARRQSSQLQPNGAAARFGLLGTQGPWKRL